MVILTTKFLADSRLMFCTVRSSIGEISNLKPLIGKINHPPATAVQVSKVMLPAFLKLQCVFFIRFYLSEDWLKNVSVGVYRQYV